VQGCSDGVTLSPHLLSEWRRLSFPLQWGNHCLQISIEPEAIKVSSTGTSPIKVSICNGPALIATPNQNYIAVRQRNGWEAWRVLE
jgi:trehalose/maltose hydrolase-like predicted phosphorylase